LTLLWLHGWPLDEHMWERQVSRFGGLAVRLYGRGNSIDGWAEEILRETEGELVVVGHSMGGYTALAMVARAPERVRSLVLAGARAGADTPERKAFRGELIARLQAEGPPDNAAPGVTVEELVTAQEAIGDRRDTSGVAATFQGQLVVCAGSEDEVFTPDEAHDLAASAPAGRAVVFESAGHFMSLDRPDEFDAVVADVLA
jgi:pimeloyl-ACP methyl ester carboxylesterase